MRLFAHLGSADPEPHRAAIESLAASGLPFGAYALGAVLRDPRFPYRREAVDALAALPHASAIEPLQETLADRDPALRARAAQALGAVVRAGVAPPEAVAGARASLGRMLAQDASPAARAAAFTALLDLGQPSDLRMAIGLAERDADPRVRCELIRARTFFARYSGSPDAIEPARLEARAALVHSGAARTPGLVERARARSQGAPGLASLDPCPDLPVVAARGLAELGDPADTALLLRLARSAPDPPLRAAAVLGLAQRGGEPGFAASAVALEDPRWSVRRSGIEALARLDSARAHALLAQLLASGTPLERVAAAEALARIPAPAGALVGAFGDPLVPVRVAAERALLERPAQVARLERSLAADLRPAGPRAAPAASDAQRGERRRAHEQRLGRWRAARADAERALAEALAAPDPRVRQRAARLLASFPGDASFALLHERLRSAHAPEAPLAAFGLGLRGDPAARSALEAAAAAGSGELALASVRALQDLGEPESLPALQALARRAPDARVRAAAARASALLDPALAAPAPGQEGP